MSEEGTVEKTYYAYIVKCVDNSYYCGYTTNLKNRIHKHNYSKTGAKYTMSRRPVTLVYSEPLLSKSEAMKRELEIKKLSHRKKEELISCRS
jgi:putative endonuclease